ncbi:MAG: metalloregulator ArsR/SmtB family transcription factor [Trueperaceae bacterium]
MERHVLPQTLASEDAERIVTLFRALSDPTRLRLVLRLSHEPCNVTNLVRALDLPQSTVSRHLSVLRGARLVVSERRGASSMYRMADSHLRSLLLEAFAHAEHERLGIADHAAAHRPKSTR